MAVRLRLRRMGRKKRPYYRIVAADSRAPRDGRFIEMVGTYNPLVKPHQIDLKEDRVFYWLENGAQPSTTVKSLFRTKGLWLKWDLKCAGADDSKIAEEFAKWELLQEEKAKRMEEQERKVKAEKKPVEEEEPEIGTGVKTEEPIAEEKAEEKTEAAEEMKETVKDEEPAPEAVTGESAEQTAEPEEKTAEENPDDREDKKE